MSTQKTFHCTETRFNMVTFYGDETGQCVGNVRTTEDSFCAGTKIIPGRASLHT